VGFAQIYYDLTLTVVCSRIKRFDSAEFKFLLLSRPMGFEICIAHKCIHESMVHRRV